MDTVQLRHDARKAFRPRFRPRNFWNCSQQKFRKSRQESAAAPAAVAAAATIDIHVFAVVCSEIV